MTYDTVNDFENAKRNRKTGYQSQWIKRGANEHHRGKPYDMKDGVEVLKPLSPEEKKKLDELTQGKCK